MAMCRYNGSLARADRSSCSQRVGDSASPFPNPRLRRSIVYAIHDTHPRPIQKHPYNRATMMGWFVVRCWTTIQARCINQSIIRALYDDSMCLLYEHYSLYKRCTNQRCRIVVRWFSLYVVRWCMMTALYNHCTIQRQQRCMKYSLYRCTTTHIIRCMRFCCIVVPYDDIIRCTTCIVVCCMSVVRCMRICCTTTLSVVQDFVVCCMRMCLCIVEWKTYILDP